MAASVKIRLLLALLSASLFFTAIVVQKTYTPLNNLNQTARVLADNLHKKESAVQKVLNNRNDFNKLKSLADDPQNALEFIQKFTTEKNIWFLTTTNGRLSFWSGVKIIPENLSSVSEGASFGKGLNGYYEAIKKSEGTFSVIFFIPVKFDYEFQNQYLQNTFAKDLLDDNNIELANYSEKNVYEIQSINNDYLFSVKLKKGTVSQKYFYLELTFWGLSLLCTCILMNNISHYIAGKKYPLTAIMVLGVFIVFVRFININYSWPDFAYQLKIFSPVLYSSNYLFPTLGDFCINISFICWFVTFLHQKRNKLVKTKPGKTAGYFILLVCIFILIVTAASFYNLFLGLVINSKISFDASNVLNLSAFSLLGVLMLCVSFFTFYLLIETLLSIVINLAIPNSTKAALFGASILLTTIILGYYQGFTFFYLLGGVLVYTRAYAYLYYKGQLSLGSFAIIIFVCSLISSMQLSRFESVKEKETRKAFIQKLEIADDAGADLIFKKIEKQIITDPSIIQYFKDSLRNTDFIKTRLQKLYLNGYLSKYEFTVQEFDNRDRPISADRNYTLNVFKDMVLYSSFQVSSYFYRENESFGYQNYFAILPVIKNGNSYGTIVIELRSRPLQESPSFPGLLVDGPVKPDEGFRDYSYAFYNDDKLLNQSGNYVYDLVNTNLKGSLKAFVFKTTKNKNDQWFLHFTTYSHLIYKPSERNLIIVSKEENPLFFGVTSMTFFFVVFLIFGVTAILARWLWYRIKILNLKNNRLRWGFKLNADLLLYKTRIQLSMVIAVVVTLVLVGFITFFSISTQYQTQQEITIRDKITRIAAAFENGPYTKYLNNVNEGSQVDFNEFANTFSSDLTLFNLNGDVLITTQPKIYEFGLQARRMNARAFINLKKLQKSEFINEEIIGKLTYEAVYMPLRDSKNETVAFLQLPYFSNVADYKERIGALLNIMINVYAIVFIAIGFFAVFIARQITAPLNFIQQSLSKTIYGKKNEPIKWERNDEIGALIWEYNKMISALEESAQRLAQSERESAWREMAKQVAHEIKNPLTPLKLGLQLLDKSWRDKDPRFDEKFERFSKSFVEQIESLSSIASEFSAFAKMPDTRIEKLNIFEILNQAVTIFKQMDNIKILFNIPDTAFMVNADRNQLLRCFNNLLKNAIEALPADREGIIEIAYQITVKSILLTIKDNGNGIAEGLHQKIFEPNFTTKSSGTGLGLAFVKNSIENAGGKVWFETILGTGTTFYISLPAA